MKTKILFLIGSFGVGGKERQLAEIIKNLPKDSFDVFMFTKSLKAHYLSQDEINNLISGIYIIERNNFKLKDIFALVKFIDQTKPDVVFSFSTTLAHFSLVAKLLCNTKFRLINGSIRSAPATHSFSSRLECILYNLYATVVANSQAGLKSFGQFNKKGRYVLYNGFNYSRITLNDKAKAKKDSIFSENRFSVLMVSSLRKDRSKDPLTFVKTAMHCMQLDSNIDFYLAGDGERRSEIEQYIQHNNIHNLTLLGNRSDVEKLLAAADVSVLTSKTEGISNSILESMACGTPVIATSMGGTPEIIENEKSGFVTPFEDYKKLAEKIIYLKNNPIISEQFSNRGQQIAHEKFSINTMIDSFSNIVTNTSTNQHLS
jgi:glycosyltransferase involved in cell wall biosynthesis